MNAPNDLNEPRSGVSRVVLLSGITAVPFALLWSWAMSFMMDWSFANTLPFGIGAGLTFGLLVGVGMGRYLKEATRRITVSHPESFNSRLEGAMAEIGFLPDFANDNRLTFKPSPRAGLMARRIAVVLEGHEATIVGPMIYLDRLVKRLSEQS